VTEKDFHGPSPAANLVQVDARELERLRQVEGAARAAVTAYDDDDDEAAVREAMEALQDALDG
jgi:hypothetical protein